MLSEFVYCHEDILHCEPLVKNENRHEDGLHYKLHDELWAVVRTGSPKPL
jgi:hypothetical protein